MKRLKAFFYTYKNSLINIAYYKDLMKVHADFSLKYALALGAFAAVITTLAVSLPLIPEVNKGVADGFDYVENAYPEDFVISAKDGEWSINKEEPFAIPTPDFMEMGKEAFENGEIEMDEETYEATFRENLVVFYHEGTINDLETYDTFMLLNSKNMIAMTDQGKIEAYPLEGIPDGEFNEAMFQDLLTQVESFTVYIPILMVTFILIGTLFYYMLFRLGYLLTVALVLLAFGNLRGLKYEYRKYYKLGMHAMTLPLTLEVMFTLLGVTAGVPLWFFGMNVIFGIIVIFNQSDDDTVSAEGEIASGEAVKAEEAPEIEEVAAPEKTEEAANPEKPAENTESKEN